MTKRVPNWQLYTYCGTDGYRWAEQMVATFPALEEHQDKLHTWFANAIEHTKDIEARRREAVGAR